MSYYPIELDKERTFKFGMKAIDRIEKNSTNQYINSQSSPGRNR